MIAPERLKQQLPHTKRKPTGKKTARHMPLSHVAMTHEKAGT